MISLSYTCKCGWRSPVLDDAVAHSNATKHHVDIRGFITPQKLQQDKSKERIEAAARQRAFDAAVLRRAKEKGLV